MRNNRIAKYIILIGLVTLTSFLFMFLFVYLFDSRLKGIAWGLCNGIFFGNLLLLLFLRTSILKILIHSVIYSIIVFIILYLSSNFILVNFKSTTLNILFLIISILTSYELTNFIVNFFFKKKN